jgi:hypothetical protein
VASIGDIKILTDREIDSQIPARNAVSALLGQVDAVLLEEAPRNLVVTLLELHNCRCGKFLELVVVILEDV